MQKMSGFTLIELIMTIVLGAIVAAVSVSFISFSSKALVDTGSRNRLAETASIISEQITRKIRLSLPGSVRVTNDNRCIEYMPLYIASVHTSINVSAAITSFQAMPASLTESYTGYVSIYPLRNGLYNPKTTSPLTPDVATLPAGSSEVTVNLASPHRFAQDSPEERVFFSGAPEAICEDGGWLYLYSGYGFIKNVNQLQAALPGSYAGGREVLAAGLQSGSVSFEYEPATLRRNALVTIAFTLQGSNGDTLSQAQEVHIRNVP